jgi:hypothetical protein
VRQRKEAMQMMAANKTKIKGILDSQDWIKKQLMNKD